jgi:hypothetical protein
MVHRVFHSAPFRALLLAIGGVLLVAASAAAQQPRQDDREIPSTPGVTPIETRSSRATTARPSRQTPGATRTPDGRRSAARHRRSRHGDSAIAGGHGPGGQIPPDGGRRAVETRSVHDPLQPRDPATWVLFGLLVVALGGVTIRMLRLPRFRPIRLERLDAEDVVAGW